MTEYRIEGVGQPIDMVRLVADVRSFAELAPNFVYDTEPHGGCRYDPDEVNELGCLIGAALAEQGVQVPGDLQMQNIHSVLGYPKGWGWMYGVQDPNVRWLSCVQNGQDEGEPWGTAVGTADDLEPLS